MNKPAGIMKRYLALMITLPLFALFLILLPAYRNAALSSIAYQAKTMFLVIPPIFILLGLMDVWVPREKMMRFMGPGSGAKGPVLAFLLGSFAAGPLYGAFPVAAMLMRKGAAFTNILVFIGAWSTTKIPMLLFEISSMGPRFALSRLLIDIAGIALIALALKAAIPKNEIDRLYREAENLT
jgi:uncharacterized membrane protein YraQ (UPF0718 family)